jgi:transcription factor TFIIIB component B''
VDDVKSTRKHPANADHTATVVGDPEDHPATEDHEGQSSSRKSSLRRTSRAATSEDGVSGATPAKRRVRRSASQSEPPRSVDGAESPRKRRQPRSPSTEPRKTRRPHAPTLPPFDPGADPGEDLDETAVTMGDLCKDTGRGHVSSKAAQIQKNHAAWKAANREKRVRLKNLLEMKKYGRGEDDTASAANATTGVHAPTGGENGDATFRRSASTEVAAAGPSAADESGQGFDYSQAVATSRFNVQVRVGPNGETVIDEESLYVDRNAEENMDDYTHVEESDTTKFVNSSTYGKKYRGSRWSAEETELFYNVSIPVLPQPKPVVQCVCRRYPNSARTTS